jgi:hypothetical protein
VSASATGTREPVRASKTAVGRSRGDEETR